MFDRINISQDMTFSLVLYLNSLGTTEIETENSLILERSKLIFKLHVNNKITFNHSLPPSLYTVHNSG